MKVKSINRVGTKPVYDISVDEVEHYVLENGVVTHNTGIQYSADNIWIIGRQQEKDGNELLGYNFIINVEKSRYLKEKSKIPILVTQNGGLNKWSGLFDVALEGKYITRTSPGWYMKVENGEPVGNKMRAAEFVDSDKFWTEMFNTTDFKEYIKKKYSIGTIAIESKQDEDGE